MSRQFKEPVSEDFVWLALDQLNSVMLLEDGEPIKSHFAGLSRRHLIRKVGIASMVALPLISSVAAPNATMAQSGCLLNVCITAGNDICAGCAGLMLNVVTRNSSNGTCAYMLTDIIISIDCTAGPVTRPFDVDRDFVI